MSRELFRNWMSTRYTNVYWQSVCTIIILCCLSMPSTRGTSSTWKEGQRWAGRGPVRARLRSGHRHSPPLASSRRSLRGICSEGTAGPPAPFFPCRVPGPPLPHRPKRAYVPHCVPDRRSWSLPRWRRQSFPLRHCSGPATEGWGFLVHWCCLYGVEQTGSPQGMLGDSSETEKDAGSKAHQTDNAQTSSRTGRTPDKEPGAISHPQALTGSAIAARHCLCSSTKWHAG